MGAQQTFPSLAWNAKETIIRCERLWAEGLILPAEKDRLRTPLIGPNRSADRQFVNI
jgi:hypothetical protein